MADAGGDHRIVAVELDERTVLWRNADVEQERRVAIFDLLEGNLFRPIELEGAGPWRLLLRVEDGRLAMDVTQDAGAGAGTILLGLDDQTEDDVKRLVDFLLEMKLDMAEFTVLVPFPHTPVREQLEREGRILHNDWVRYTGSEVVYRPAKMSPDTLEKMYHYAWDAFYKEAMSGDYNKALATCQAWFDVS